MNSVKNSFLCILHFVNITIENESTSISIMQMLWIYMHGFSDHYILFRLVCFYKGIRNLNFKNIALSRFKHDFLVVQRK